MALILLDFPLLLLSGFSKNRNKLPFNIFEYKLFHQDKHSCIFKQEMPTLHSELPTLLPKRQQTIRDGLIYYRFVPPCFSTNKR